MMKRFARGIFGSRPGGERGAVALMIVLAFMLLAIPLSLASAKMADQFAIGSRVYNSRLASQYAANAGAEYAIWKILNDPSFDDGLTPDEPSKALELESNGETVDITTTKIFPGGDLQGQGLVVTKAVNPTTAPVNQQTTFIYTITIRNQGSQTVYAKQICDYLTPLFSYVSGSTGGDITTSDPTVEPDAGQSQCGACALLTWGLTPKVPFAAGETKTLTFNATATLPEGTYYNQARVRYDPWWSASYVYVYIPYSAEATVGSGTPKCGFDMRLLVSKQADPPQAPPGVQTEVEYTITVENVTSSTVYLCQIEDLLPPDYTYVEGSSADYPDNIDTRDPALSQEPHGERGILTWQNAGDTPLTSIAGGQVKTQVFRALVTPEPGVNYYNEVSVTWSAGTKCGKGEGGMSNGGTGESSSVVSPPMYDICVVASDGTILTRVLLWGSSGQIEILSWQQY